MKKYVFKSLLIFLFFSPHVFATEHLVFAIDLIRHGDRTPIHQIPNSTYPWKEGFGELTAKGMQQEYELGVELRKRYVDQYHLLPEEYNAESIYIRSTDKNRTLQSAQSFLLGLYPLGTGPQLSDDKPALPQRFQPIPIHTVPVDEDTLLQSKSNTNFLYRLESYFSSHQEWQVKTRAAKAKLKYWSKVTGMRIANLHQLAPLGDNIFIRQLHHLPLPDGITAADAKEILELREWTITRDYKKKELYYPMGHTFLQTIVTYFDQATKSDNKLKYVLFSAHDSTIMCVLATLGAAVTQIPPYASHVTFALFEDNKQYIVKMTYNNKPIDLPNCRNGICTLEEFKKI